MSLLLGTGFTALAFATLKATSFLGSLFLMPGIYLGEALLRPFGAVTDGMLGVFIANAFIFSGAALFLLTVLSTGRPYKRAGRLFGFVILTIVVTVGVGWYAANKWNESGNGLCGNDVVEQVKSPDGQNKAVIFVRNCGATTDFSTQVSIMPPTKNINHADTGNVFTADSDHGAAAVSGLGALDVRVAWSSPTSITISHPLRARVFVKETKYKNIAINYSTRS
jgi:hypothetical protein